MNKDKDTIVRLKNDIAMLKREKEDLLQRLIESQERVIKLERSVEMNGSFQSATQKFLHNPLNSKKAKIARNESISQRVSK